MDNKEKYSVVDTLYAWYLGNPSNPKLIGTLNLFHALRGVSLRYDSKWLTNGFALSEDLPLIDREHFPTLKETAVGAIDDARPDRWGERVIRLLERPQRLSILEMLYFAGDGRFGALGISTSESAYLPFKKETLPRLDDVDAIHKLVQRVQAGEQIEEVNRRLIAPGATMGGARPKALIEIDSDQWVLKFPEEGHWYEPSIEHASMTLARIAGINAAETRLITLAKGHAIAIKRFDRATQSNIQERMHCISVNVALRAAGSAYSYPAMAQFLRRRGVTDDQLNQIQMREIFKRLIFNILIDNTDDHEKNHAFIYTKAGQYSLSPAFDVLPTGQAFGYQAMDVGENASLSTVDNALSMSSSYGITLKDAKEEAKTVAQTVNNWRDHFKTYGVDHNVITQIGQQIDRDFLRMQREKLLK
jgi:serine/threonine-protein kinase HipA